MNVTVTQSTDRGNLRLHPPDVASKSSVINYTAGQTRANNAIVALDAEGRVAVFCAQATGTAHMILDVNGYFE